MFHTFSQILKLKFIEEYADSEVGSSINPQKPSGTPLHTSKQFLPSALRRIVPYIFFASGN